MFCFKLHSIRAPLSIRAHNVRALAGSLAYHAKTSWYQYYRYQEILYIHLIAAEECYHYDTTSVQLGTLSGSGHRFWSSNAARGENYTCYTLMYLTEVYICVYIVCYLSSNTWDRSRSPSCMRLYLKNKNEKTCCLWTLHHSILAGVNRKPQL